MTVMKTQPDDTGLLDQMFDAFFDWQRPPQRFSYRVAPLDLYEKDGNYVLEMSVPGFDPKEIHVEVSGGTVRVIGKHTERFENNGVRYHRQEIRRDSFSRTVTLPQDIDPDAVTAKVDKGVLNVQLVPVKPISPKKIEVKPA